MTTTSPLEVTGSVEDRRPSRRSIALAVAAVAVAVPALVMAAIAILVVRF
ncbi:hypothetical protein NY547_11320 [Cnuibacter physcomitrellae]|nr:hypothetical protein [Cnuibacter physcomitrellae]MCS5497827.1 hypothetical protein [Cnuibacter physcomitrellae]